VPVIVGADRYQAGIHAENHFDSSLHLLDDGFQHRGLHRDFDIVMLPAEDLEDTVLPLGRLREPLSSLRRADAVFITGAAVDEPAVRRWMNEAANLWRAERTLEIGQACGRAVAFCGIARPRQFFEQLRSKGIELADTVAFPDHHRYSDADLSRLLRVKAAAAAQCFITTEKDLINLDGLAQRLQPLHLARLRIAVHNEDVTGTILRTVEKRCGCRFQPPA
jgi:tetraacyldisaccharide 4'-kinase